MKEEEDEKKAQHPNEQITDGSKPTNWVFMESNYLFVGSILQKRKSEKGRERGRASEVEAVREK